MVDKLINFEDNAEVYSVIRKKFTNLTGKSGRILRAICPHGLTYAVSNQEVDCRPRPITTLQHIT